MNKLSIIIPYRDRKDHLQKIIPHLKNFLKDLNLNIIVVEQDDLKDFNKGILMNVGALMSDESTSYYCFHDVDLLPSSNECDYSFINGVTKLATRVSQFGFQHRPFPPLELGGVVLIDKESFIKINGWCNEYRGWGIEDDDFGERCLVKKINIEQRNGLYLSLPHPTRGDTLGGLKPKSKINNENYFINAKKTNSLFNSGLNNVKYEIVLNEQKEDYTLIKVKT